MSYDYYGGGGYGGGGYGRDRDHYGGGHGRDRDDYGGGYRRNHDDYGRDRDRGFRGGYDRQDRYDDRRSGGRGWGGFGGGDNRRSRGGWSGGDRNRGRGWGGGRGGGRGMKRDYSGGGGPPSKYFKEESDNNWEESDRHQLMQSVFMDKKPEDLEESWVFLVCPPGKRRVLVAARDVTESYNNAGIPDMKFKSCLPSGSPIMNDVHKHDDLTILDTVYSAEKKRYYIVDMLHWKHYPYYDTDAEFRFFCLPDKYSQLKQPLEKTDNNEYPLELLSKYPADKSSIEEQLKAATGKVEGLLFIRKLSTYECRDSENCMWLKLDKMEETLGIPIPEGVVFAASNTKDEKRRTEQTERQLLKEHRSLKEDAPLAQEGKGDSELEEKEETEEAPDGHDEESAGYEETAEEGYDNSGYKDEEYYAEADQETNEEGE